MRITAALSTSNCLAGVNLVRSISFNLERDRGRVQYALSYRLRHAFDSHFGRRRVSPHIASKGSPAGGLRAMNWRFKAAIQRACGALPWGGEAIYYGFQRTVGSLRQPTPPFEFL